jgi:hypothetical protein
LNFLILALEIVAQDLREFQAALRRLGQHDFRPGGRDRGRGRKLQKTTANEGHDVSPLLCCINLRATGRLHDPETPAWSSKHRRASAIRADDKNGFKIP